MSTIPFSCWSSASSREYFAGARKAFDLPLDFFGTAFQKRVWFELLNIPFGETRTYGEIAHAIGKPRAFRAVGAANGKNPISIVAPCHRVIGKDGSLTGFAGGLAAKECLLGIEAGIDRPPRGDAGINVATQLDRVRLPSHSQSKKQPRDVGPHKPAKDATPRRAPATEPQSAADLSRRRVHA